MSRVAIVTAGLWIHAAIILSAQQSIDFQRDIRPILSDNCFHCHGPDQSTRMAGLRLDLRDGAFSKRPRGAPVVAGKPDESLVYQRISAEDPARRMPPPSAHKTLTDAQKETLRKWIAGGAAWKEHWSFIAPIRPNLPAASRRIPWNRNPIDRFILAKIDAAGLVPAPEADRRTLARRVSLDLKGLPPTPQEIDAFVNDKSADAYEKMVDRLLASPRFGEHRAHYWLDAARYGDTNGLHYDNYRGGIWHYRDWVVNAFNRNLGYDKFVVEQLAGDLLASPTLDQLIATGFCRNNVTTNENGVIEEEVTVMYAKDRADTAATVFLGLTTACATCHDHKFDPISQKDHYALEAFFNNTTQMVMDDNRPDAPPIIFVPRDEDRARWLTLNQQRESIEKELARVRQAGNPAFDRWVASGSKSLQHPLAASTALAVSAQTSLPPGVTLGASPWGSAQALTFDGKSSLELPGVSVITGDAPFSFSFWVQLAEITRHPGLTGSRVATPVAASQLVRVRSTAVAADADADTAAAAMLPRGWQIDFDEGVPALKLYGDGGKVMRALSLRNAPLAAKTWTHLAFTYDGSRKEEGLSLYVNGTAVPLERGGYGTQNSNVVQQLDGSLANGAPLLLGSDGTTPKFKGSIADFRVFSLAITEHEARLAAAWPAIAGLDGTAPSEIRSEIQKDALRLYYLSEHDSAYQMKLEDMAKLDAELRQMRNRAATAIVMQERADSKATARLLYRGMYDQPREEVEANVPSALPPMPASYPRNRLGLAKWLVDPANPLTARVAVNRFWQELFGAGIVRTAGDFGSQGEPPSHPELLDWLAVEFRESGWDVKKLFRLMLTSAAYRQAAVSSEAVVKVDPENRLLARGPRFRLDGEVIRDLALAAGGLLVETMGGPPVKPYQPAGVWEATSMPVSNTRHYTQDHGQGLYRRSLYTLWKRSAPPASMEIFDGPTRETCVVRRERTNTPLQALAIMNDPQLVEAARNLAAHAMTAADLRGRVDFMTLRLLARTIDAKERAAVERSYQRFLSHYDSNRDDAKKLLAVGESKADARLPQAELAALTMVANQLLSLDETLSK